MNGASQAVLAGLEDVPRGCIGCMGGIGVIGLSSLGGMGGCSGIGAMRCWGRAAPALEWDLPKWWLGIRAAT